MRQLFGVALCAALLVGLATLGVSADEEKKEEKKEKKAGKNHTVTMKDNKFEPKEIKIKVGDTITWVNKGCNTHTATSDKGTDKDSAFDTKDVEMDKSSKSVTFKKAGKISYHCEHHGSMTGKIVVEEEKKAEEKPRD